MGSSIEAQTPPAGSPNSMTPPTRAEVCKAY